MAVGVAGEKSHKRIDDHETRPYVTYPLLDECQVLRYGEEPVVAVAVGHGGEGEYLRRVGSGGVQPWAYSICEAVLRREQDHAGGVTFGAVREGFTGRYPRCKV